MNKFLKWGLIAVVGLVAVMFVAGQFIKMNTKKHSPERVVNFEKNGLEIDVFYNGPFKKARPIFGGLVPFGEIWRTGANEATTFSTNQDIMIGGQKLEAGEYTLWTIPDRQKWQVIFNGKNYDWGVNWDGVASREASHDVLNVAIPPQEVSEIMEQFTITVAGEKPIIMKLAWDNTEVIVPIETL